LSQVRGANPKKNTAPVFIPLSVVYEAIDLMAELNSENLDRLKKI
jgi:hypothetical protein